MSMLGEQIKELRESARQFEGYQNGEISRTLREAADTIESLRDRLQTSDGQSCYATQANYEHCKYSTDRGWRDTSRYAELFGTPERAARTIADACTTDFGDGCIGCPAFGAKCGCGGYDALLEWLRGDA